MTHSRRRSERKSRVFRLPLLLALLLCAAPGEILRAQEEPECVAADQETPFRYPEEKGTKIEVEVDGVKLTATLLEDRSPKTVGA